MNRSFFDLAYNRIWATPNAKPFKQTLGWLLSFLYKKRLPTSIILFLMVLSYWRSRSPKLIKNTAKEATFNIFSVSHQRGLPFQAHTFFRHWINHQFIDFVKKHNLTAKKLFISYSWPSLLYNDYAEQNCEKQAIWQMVRDLKHAGVLIWLDHDQSRLGDQLSSNQFTTAHNDSNIIMNGLDRCDAIILFGTTTFLKKCQASEGSRQKHLVYMEAEHIHHLRLTRNKVFYPAFLSRQEGIEAIHCMPNRLLDGRRTWLNLTSTEDYFEAFLKLIKDIYLVPPANPEFEWLINDFSTELKAFCQKTEANRIRLVQQYKEKLKVVEADVDKRSSRKDWEIPSTQIFRYDAHPLERNLLFIPRPFPCEPTQKFIALTGLAGSGKTQLVKNYYLNSVSDNQYKGYVWFQANDHNQLISQCRAFLCSLKISFEPENLQQKFRDFFIGKKDFCLSSIISTT